MNSRANINLRTLFFCFLFCISTFKLISQEDKLYVGWAVADITPDKPVALVGQMHKRISVAVETPLNATILALETVGNNNKKEQVIMVSCDVMVIRAQTQKKLQVVISGRLIDFDASKLFLNATHSHTASAITDDDFFKLYNLDNDPGVMKPSEYEAFFIEKISEAVVKAWKSRKPGGFTCGLGNAILGHNRRTVQFNGTARMYGVNDPGFSHYEGTDDNKVQMLFFWDQNKSLTGIIINTTATAQVTDGTKFVSADFYHEARQIIKQKYGKDIFLLFQIGAAGDITPSCHEYTYRQAENYMLKKKGITARQEIANRLLQAVDEVFPYMNKDIEYNTVLKHTVAKVELPANAPSDPSIYMVDDVKPAEFHVIRLGDIAMATNPFELFVDYGVLMRARSKALFTFVVQLACHYSGYLPTERAEKGGGYSAEKTYVGSAGGYKLVDETVKRINEMWD